VPRGTSDRAVAIKEELEPMPNEPSGKTELSSSSSTLAAPEVPLHEQFVDLWSGDGYRAELGADEITCNKLTTVVLVAGTAESGKTTLLAALYLMFRKKPFAGYLFAGSRTLVGFEKRVHASRIVSGLDKPTTERTKVSELLHLRVRKQDCSDTATGLLLCDLWGEDFRDARDTVDGCKRLGIIRRADALVLLVDGEKLSQPEMRQEAKSDPILLMRNMLDCEMLAETALVDIVFTKWDLIQQSLDRAECEGFAAHIENEMRRHFDDRVGELKFWRVAAHSRTAFLPLGYGLEDLFRSWVERPPGAARHHLRLVPESEGACEYDKYLRRRMAQVTS
jgi:hypothetical protein